MATDPVCGMYVDEASSELTLLRGNRTYYFCAPSCRDSFAAPGQYRDQLRRRLAVAVLGAAVAILGTYLPHPAWVDLAVAGAATVVQIYAGAPFYRGAWEAIRGRVGNMDLLVAVATSAAFAYSVGTFVVPALVGGARFFDASTGILALLLAGQFLEAASRDRAAGALRALAHELPPTAERADDGRIVPVDTLNAGDRVMVRPGGRFPVDGTVLDGRTEVNEAILTGEPGEIPKGPGDRCLAGSTNGTGAVTVRVEHVGPDTFLAGVGRLLTEAEASRVPMQRTADRLARRFAPFVLGVGTLAGAAWILLGHAPFLDGLLVFVTVTITACPCAFGLATPAAVAVGVGRAAEAGILFQGTDAIERADRVDRVFFDKTGTLTEGRPTVREVTLLPGLDEGRLFAAVAALERGSEHPVARAIVTRADRSSAGRISADDVRALPGDGVQGRVDGHVWAVRARPEGALPTVLTEASQRAVAAGQGWSCVLQDGAAVAILSFEDPIAPGAGEAVRALQADGLGVALVTGDRRAAAERVAGALGIPDVHAELTPAGKLAVVRAAFASGGHPAFVGDGINDAPALLAADLGIAIGTGTEVARSAGQVLLVRPDLGAVPTALRLARATTAKVRGNLRWAVGYNAILLPIAAGALVPWLGFGVYQVLPFAGAAAMALSSTLVVTNSLSLRWSRLGPGAVRRAVRPI